MAGLCNSGSQPLFRCHRIKTVSTWKRRHCSNSTSSFFSRQWSRVFRGEREGGRTNNRKYLIVIVVHLSGLVLSQVTARSLVISETRVQHHMTSSKILSNESGSEWFRVSPRLSPVHHCATLTCHRPTRSRYPWPSSTLSHPGS